MSLGDGDSNAGRRPLGPKNTIRMQSGDGANEPTPQDPLPFRFALEAEATRAAADAPRVEAPAVAAARIETPQVSAVDVKRALQIGRIIGGYRTTRLVGAGGFAEVYAVEHLATGKPYAIKVLNIVEAGRQASVERFDHECSTLFDLRNYEGVVRVYDKFPDAEAGTVMVMELLCGMTLRDALKAGKLTLLDKLHIAVRIARAMAFLHVNEVVHRDLKPENIFLELEPGMPEGAVDRFRPVILDLGCAKTTDGPTTSSNSITTTWEYASPEMLGRGEFTIRSDIYAFGCILYEMFEGKKCFHRLDKKAGNAIPIGTKIQWHILVSAEMPQEMPVAIWNEIASICLEKDPDDRFQTMQDVEAALTTFIEVLVADRVPRDDLLPAALAGARARPCPKPLPQLSAAGRAEDTPPRQVRLEDKIVAPSFVVVEGPAEMVGARWAIGRALTIGRWMKGEPRDGIADITFPLDTLSTRHVRLEAALEEAARSVYLVQDLKSTNGTQLSGNPIREGLLRPGGTLRLGRQLVLRLYGPGTIAEQDAARPITGEYRAPLQGRPATRPMGMEGPRVEVKSALTHSTLQRQVEIRSAVDDALAGERARASRRFNLMLGGMVAFGLVIVVVVLQMLHLLPSWLGGGR